MTDCKGSLTVEMTLLFLSVFFLLVLLLRTLFGLGSILLLHSLEERALMIWQGAETEETMEDNLSSIVRSYCQSSPLPFQYQNLGYEMTNSLLGIKIQLQLQGEFTLAQGVSTGGNSFISTNMSTAAMAPVMTKVPTVTPMILPAR